MIESFFNKMAKQKLKDIRIGSKEKLERHIHLYFEKVNRDPIIYHLTYKMDDISVAEAIEAGVKTTKVCAS